ncbi:MAG: hypothetical protein AUJ57_03245 [Zetaproteobacteria bacterium CG1_02_53_45]|nr:MAG: hypothetical protein AUJ57_03245 [Zetaproteobacteria bacterium CG1_02_53_45]
MNGWTKMVLVLVALGLFSSLAEARKDIGDYSIKDALSRSDGQEKMKDDIALYFGSQKHPKAIESFGEFSTNKKTNAFNKSDKMACEWAFLSAIIQLQTKAASLGGNAVINIKSNYDRDESSSSKTFKCAAGSIIAGVALKGTVVKIRK